MGFEAVATNPVSLVFFFLICSHSPRLAAGDHRRHRRLVAKIPDFISIDCGAPKDSVDKTTEIPYKSDNNMMESGISSEVSSDSYAYLPMPYKYLRSFPEGVKNCYTLKPEAGKNNRYLIRATFIYGNYDGRNSTPVFNIYLGVDLWETVQSGYVLYEVILFASTDYLDVCLVNIESGVPYISVLELRRLDNVIYPTANNKLMSLWYRFDVGGEATIRYPQDVYDRVWYPSQFYGSYLKKIWTNERINESNGDSYKPPESMLKTAYAAANSSLPIFYRWGLSTMSEFCLCFHFAELEKLAPGKVREMSIVYNGVHTIAQSIKLEYLKPLTICSTWLPTNIDRQNYFYIYGSSHSDLPPTLNGLEMFYSRDFTSPTFLQDVNGIMDIKQRYELGRNWQGDPCLPASYMWEGLNCSFSDPPRIISLNLSGSKLTGKIAISFSNLTALEYLDLSYNELTGPLPEFLAKLPQLKTLNLVGNNFTGIVPNALIQKSRSGILNLSLNANPEFCLSTSCKKKRKYFVPVLASVIAAIITVILLSVLVIFTRKRRGNLSKSKGALELKNRQFSFSEVVSMTENFKTMIGEGGFGKVYLGTLKDETLVAVKLLSASSKQGYREFQAEAQLLMIVHHRHLVSLVGYCDAGENKALIYEFMANGNVLQHMSERSTQILNWRERLQIAVDAAQGLEYLHIDCKPPIIHRDMKTSNILLSDKMQAKIADFGLSRILKSENTSHLSTTPAGTFGYIDPEVHPSGNYTKKSDVYSFGIVLLELITGKPAIMMGEEYNVHILGWIQPLIEQGNIENILDSRLLNGGLIENDSAKKVIELALWCTLPTSDQRPDMSCVVTELKECLKKVQGYEMSSYASIDSDSIISLR